RLDPAHQQGRAGGSVRPRAALVPMPRSDHRRRDRRLDGLERNWSGACVRQAQLIGAARRPPSTTTTQTSPITLSIPVAGSGTELVLRTRLPWVTSRPNGSPRKATYPCSPPFVVPCAVSW